MMNGTPVMHRRKHNMGNPRDHEGDIYDALINAPNTLTGTNPAADKKYVDDEIIAALKGLDWQESVLARQAAPPGSPVAGARYLVIATATGDWAGHEDDIAQWDDVSSTWKFTTPDKGFAALVEAEKIAYIYLLTPTAGWVTFGNILNHNDLLNLTWSTAGHTIDDDIDMNGYKQLDSNQQEVLYVSHANGDDTTGDGGDKNPYKTIQAAVDTATDSTEMIIITDQSNPATESVSVPINKVITIIGQRGFGYFTTPFAGLDVTAVGFCSLNNLVLEKITGVISGAAPTFTINHCEVRDWTGGLGTYYQNVHFTNTKLASSTVYESILSSNILGNTTGYVFVDNSVRWVGRPATSQTLYVSYQHGSDSIGNGEEDNRFQTIQRAIDIIEAGTGIGSIVTDDSGVAPESITATGSQIAIISERVKGDWLGGGVGLGTVTGVSYPELEVVNLYVYDVKGSTMIMMSGGYLDNYDGVASVDWELKGTWTSTATLANILSYGSYNGWVLTGYGVVTGLIGLDANSCVVSNVATPVTGTDAANADYVGTEIGTHASDTDAHHDKSHAHDGVDGSGTVAHSDLTGIGTDDHHTRYADSEAQAAVKYQADVTLAGATPVDADVSAWADGDRGMGIGTGGRVFMLYKQSGAVKYVELS